MKNSVNRSTRKAPRQEQYNTICATCTHNCKQAPVAQLVCCLRYTDSRLAHQKGEDKKE